MSGQVAFATGLTVLAVFAVLTGALILRRVIISRRGGVIECGLRHSSAVPGGQASPRVGADAAGAHGGAVASQQNSDAPWQHGLAEYRLGHLYWHRSMSLRLRPHAVFDRSQLAVLRSRPAMPAENLRLGPGMVIVRCQGMVRHRGRPAERREVELAMTREALTGLLSWLESSPVYPIRRAS